MPDRIVLTQAGRMRLAIRRAEWPLETSVAFATRQNPRRLYLFVSKLLGKHWPVRPSRMQAAHQTLACKIANLPGPLLVIGLAETATALGRGVAEEAARLAGRTDVLYLQTTRYLLSHHLAFQFDESHSHAPDHAVYWPQPSLQALFQTAQTLVLVDDEISTGRTLVGLAQAYLQINPDIERIALVCLTNWLSEERQQEIGQLLARPVSFPALIEGSFQFEPDPQFPLPTLPVAVARARCSHAEVTADPARTGVLAGRWAMPSGLEPPLNQPLAVIGTGEYTYTPYRLALALEQQGYDVYFQSTTRSPILVGDAIQSRREFLDPYGDGMVNYLYNLAPERCPILCYEHPGLTGWQALADALGGLAWMTEPVCATW